MVDLEALDDPRLVGDSWLWFKDELSGKADKTQKNYLKNFMGFLEFYDYTTESLFEEHLANTRAEDPRKKKLVPKKLVRFQRHLMDERGLKSGTVREVEKAVASFFRANEVDFKMNGGKIKVETSEIPTIQKEELVLLLSLTGSIRMKAGIHTLKDGGMRVGDLCNIRVEDVKDCLTGKLEYYTWEFKQEKTGGYANPVIGPEAIKWLKLWMRKREMEGIESEWLFTTVENYRGRPTGSKLKGDNLSQLFLHLRNKAGLKEKRVSIHSLRKYHKTTLEYAGVPTSWVNKMQGRKGEGTGGIYTKPNPEQLIEIYSKGYPKLSLKEEISHEDVEDLQKQIIEQQRMIDEMMPAFNIAKKMIDKERELDRLLESAREP